MHAGGVVVFFCWCSGVARGAPTYIYRGRGQRTRCVPQRSRVFCTLVRRSSYTYDPVTATTMTVVAVVMMMMMTAVAVAMAVVTGAAAATGVTVDNVAVRLGLPEGQGLSGVCLYRNGADKRQNVMFKSVASARKKHGGDYMVAGDLAADRVYEGTFARLTDGDQVARFGCKGGQRFEIATPFVVPERDLDTILAVKESMERRFGAQPSRQQPHRSVTEEHVSVTLRGLRPAATADSGPVTVDVFQLYKRQGAANGGGGVMWDASAAGNAAAVPRYRAYPYARYALPHPVGSLVLADLPPDQMLAVKLRGAANDDHGNRTENAIFIYTGGLYPRGTANLTDMLMDERSGGHGSIVAEASPPDITEAAATSFQIDAKLVHRDSYGKRSPTHVNLTLANFFNGR